MEKHGNIKISNPSVYKSGSLTSNNRIKEQNTKVLTQEQITTISKETETNKENPGSSIQNFQRRINSLAPNYSFQKVVIDNSVNIIKSISNDDLVN